MTDIKKIFEKYYPAGNPLSQLVWEHSRQVADLAEKMAISHPHLDIDRKFLYEAAMLHDIGVYKTHAPGILCHGDAHYMTHGLIGAEILREEGMPRHALVCERHIGVGLTAQEIIEQQLPLPHRDMLPITLEEKLVCYADNFFSKSHPYILRSYDDVYRSVARFGKDNIERLERLAAIFGK